MDFLLDWGPELELGPVVPSVGAAGDVLAGVALLGAGDALDSGRSDDMKNQCMM